MKTHLINNQKTLQLNEAAIQQLADGLADSLAAATEGTPWGEITLTLTDDAGMTPINLEFFAKNRPTDVITFRYDPIPGEDPEATGDLVVNVECAVREGELREGIQFELALYIAHGFDHLSGADDNTPEKRAAMRATELGWLNALNADTDAAITPKLIIL